MLRISGGTILTPAGPLDGALLCDGKRIAAVGPEAAVPAPAGAVEIDACGLLVAPGMIDLQLNGAFGLDFTADPATIWEVAVGLPRYGVTAFLPTIITAPPEAYQRAQAALAAGPPPGFVGARSLGLHLEGPFLHPDKRGAHNPAHLRHPEAALAADWSSDRGVRLVTLAPELPGALKLIEQLSARGVVVSLGHSSATFEQACAGIAAGAHYATHLFNAMPALGHREPGLVGAALAAERLVAGLIADGIHIHTALIGVLWRTLGPERLNLVTDAMAALGMPDGTYQLGDRAVSVADGIARLADGTLAGSVLALDQAVRNLMNWVGCPLDQALRTVTTTPAELLGLTDQIGVLAPGRRADLALLTPAGEVAATIVGGRVAYSRESYSIEEPLW